MSGGQFDYKEYQLEYIADCIQDIIRQNDEGEFNSWGGHIDSGIVTKMDNLRHNLLVMKDLVRELDLAHCADTSYDQFNKEYDEIMKELKI